MVQGESEMNVGARILQTIGSVRGRRCLAAGLAALAWGVSPAFAAAPLDANNKGVVELETDSSTGISVRIAEDLAGLIDDGATRRVLPVVGRSARQNITDLVALRGIDMAILQTDVLDSLRQQRMVPPIEASFTYIAKLYNEEFHLLAGANVKTIGDLAHRRVNIGIRGSGTSVTAQRLFDLLKIQIEPVFDRPEVALARLRNGDIDAVAFVAGKPAPLFEGMPRDDRLHFVPVPLDGNVINAYVPTTLTAEDYPGLVPAGQAIDTVAVGSILAVAPLPPETERYRNVVNFVDIFFTQFRGLLEPGHNPKWSEINLAADAPGWRRFPPAQQWLDRNSSVAKQSQPDVKTVFSRFLDTRQLVIGGKAISEKQKQELYDQFQKWQAGQAH
jgi:TRAP-type uncharacterized transport system substrate-binding protein